MKPEDRRRLKQHIDMIVNHNAPSVTFCPNCECERETTLYSEVRECTFCMEEFEVVGGIKPSNSDVSMTESVLMDIKTGQSVKNICPRCGKKLESGEFHKLPQCIDYLIGMVSTLEEENSSLVKRNTELEENFSQFIGHLRCGHNEKAHLQMLVLEVLVKERETNQNTNPDYYKGV